MITLGELEAKLWGAADILRGAIDSSDYKNYIFGFLLLKRLSDVFEEEAEKIEQETGDHELAWNEPDEHRFFVPEAARWSRLRSLTQHIGQELNIAIAALEDANPKLEGILIGIDFNNEGRLRGPKQRDEILGKLILHFSNLNLRNSNLIDPASGKSEPDILGQACEYLLEYFADAAGKAGSEFHTPKKVVELLVRLLDPEEGMRICDPTCGSGGMLIECVYHLKKRKGGNPCNLSLFGQESNLNTWALAQTNILLHDIFDFDIRQGDTLQEPALVHKGKLMLFDIVVANPPFNMHLRGYERAEHDSFQRFRYGLPPTTRGDYAFIQHMVATLNERGRLGVIVPHGVLFRGGGEGKIRQRLLEGNPLEELPGDLVETVIGLAPNLLYSTGIPIAILILNRAKAAERKGRVLFIDASREYEAGKSQNHLRDHDIDHIVATYQTFKDEPKYAAVVSLDEIRKNDYNLNISRYVVTTEPEPEVDLVAELRKLRDLEKQRSQAEQEMNEYLRALGLELEI
ncbi:class I SAM-dependent DNA methyltransferase [Leptolyngbya sp. FACHB-16]|uniref:type I restriction-modification system subunit M n=1 Tax=unclassified Leptolyngbya TaxID=2650499 RepID=UPI001684B728|nr:class I SAM-dependent DNA methyltransferase [Leptolyngbya sp. FACHB-16]MBD2156734.1 SAM-dependent DNA methyltransferase [Leptolyngbya sp. FACHB-16]